jgi:hypothetical protein
MRSSNVRISIRYCDKDAKWSEARLSPEQFFWPDPDDPDEQWVIGSPWLHDDVTDYLPGAAETVARASVHLIDETTGGSQVVEYHFWGGPRNYTSIVDWLEPGKPPHKELIHVHDLPFYDNASQTLRVDLSDCRPTTTLNIILHGRNGDEFNIDLIAAREDSQSSTKHPECLDNNTMHPSGGSGVN